MRILHVLDHSLPLQSGYTFRTLRIIEGQRSLGYETFHLTGVKQGETQAQTEHSHGLAFYRTPDLKSWQKAPLIKQIFAILALRKTLKKAIETIKPDVLHVHSPVINGLAALGLSKKYHIPMVYEIRAFWEDAAVDHGTHKPNSLRYKLSKALESYVVKRAQHITTICEGLKVDLQGRGLSADKITVIANAVDTPSMVGKKIDHAFLLKLENEYHLKEKYVIGFIGSFYAYEGLDLLIQSIAKLKTQIARLSVLLVGGGPEEARLSCMIKEYKLEDIVHMIPRVPHDEVIHYYGVCDLCVYPRKRMRLTELVTPLKPLEAMAAGVPVLASNVGGHKELIQQKVTGFLFEAENVEALTRAILERHTQSKPVEVIFKARNYILEQRNWKSTTQPYKQVFEDVLAS